VADVLIVDRAFAKSKTLMSLLQPKVSGSRLPTRDEVVKQISTQKTGSACSISIYFRRPFWLGASYKRHGQMKWAELR